ncbi:hypothetical protein AB832_02915 [Flavobacteriaceae bacterium (ex Bugula neritina AB1)]|nr:hypothetical protein AB832_02915 [Flavobacteriaceae bacterium (ex Bugula neritina AB1)]
MKAFSILILFQFLFNHTRCFSQDITMTKEVEGIVELGKEAITELALEVVKGKVGVENFKKIKVLTDGEEVFVSFRNPIKYLPLESSFYFDIGVHLLRKTISRSPVSNPGNYYLGKRTPFYRETEDIKKNIQFILASINKSTEVGSIEVEHFEDDMIIRENKEYYTISVVSELQESYYKIEKKSGRVYDVEHIHLEPSPFANKDEVIFKEIH